MRPPVPAARGCRAAAASLARAAQRAAPRGPPRDPVARHARRPAAPGRFESAAEGLRAVLRLATSLRARRPRGPRRRRAQARLQGPSGGGHAGPPTGAPRRARGRGRPRRRPGAGRSRAGGGRGRCRPGSGGPGATRASARPRPPPLRRVARCRGPVRDHERSPETLAGPHVVASASPMLRHAAAHDGLYPIRGRSDRRASSCSAPSARRGVEGRGEGRPRPPGRPVQRLGARKAKRPRSHDRGRPRPPSRSRPGARGRPAGSVTGPARAPRGGSWPARWRPLRRPPGRRSRSRRPGSPSRPAA